VTVTGAGVAVVVRLGIVKTERKRVRELVVSKTKTILYL
jgi:hypothetical protein